MTNLLHIMKHTARSGLEFSYRKAKTMLIKLLDGTSGNTREKIKRQLIILELVYYENYSLQQLAVKFETSVSEIKREVKDLLRFIRTKDKQTDS